MPRMTTTAIRITGVDFAYVPVTDFERAKQFYGEVLGLEQSKQYGKMPGGEFETGTLTLQILQPEAFGQQFNRNPNPLAFHVDDVQEARAQLEAQGIEFLGETMDSGVCHMAFFQDPDGHVLCLHHRYAPPEARPPGLE
jgi:predicted enzyme related to lactoylglutathione lyase